MRNRINNKKGGAGIKLVLVGILMIALFLGYTYLKMNWRKFKADFSFGFAIAAFAIIALLIIYLVIKHKIKKHKKEKEAKKAAAAAAKEAAEAEKAE